MTVGINADLLEYSETKIATVASSVVCSNAFRLDASAFLNTASRAAVAAAAESGSVLSDMADVFTVYIQTPLLQYVQPFANSLPYLTTSELGEFQRGVPTHVSLLTDPRLIEWQIARDTIILSRSGRVGEAYWVDKKLAEALVGDSFRIVPKTKQDAYFLYALLTSTYARNYITGVTYGSVVDHASVDQVRSLPVPVIPDRLRTRIGDLINKVVLARDAAYDLLDAAETALLRVNGLNALNSQASAQFNPLGQPVCFSVNAKQTQTAHDDGSEYRLDAHFYNPNAQLAIDNIKMCRSEIKSIGDVARVIFTGGRFKRNYVESMHGVPFLSGKNTVQIRPTDLKHLSNVQMTDLQELLLQRGCTLITRSGTIGRTCFVWKNYEDYAGSEHILRVIPNEGDIDPGYMYAFVSSQYGYEQILRYRHGSVIDEVTDKQIECILIPRPSRREQTAIGDKVREAYEKRAEAIRLEDEAQAILMKELTKAPGAKGVQHVRSHT
jgi:type I restriction enzyme S subunit